MEKLENLDQNELVELWRQLQSLTQEETRDCGDVALLWHLAERLDLVNILDQAAGKREQGRSVGLLTVLMAIHRDVDPGSKRIKGHIFICQLALLLRRVLEMLLKLSGIQMTSRRALRQVKSVRIVKKTLSVVSEPLWQLNRISEEIQRIFDAVGLALRPYLRNLELPLPP